MDKKDQQETDFEKASGRVIKTIRNWSIGFTLTTVFLAASIWSCPHKGTGKKSEADSLKSKEIILPTNRR